MLGQLPPSTWTNDWYVNLFKPLILAQHQLQGYDVWKRKPSNPYYDSVLVRKVVDNLREMVRFLLLILTSALSTHLLNYSVSWETLKEFEPFLKSAFDQTLLVSSLGEFTLALIMGRKT
jgi:hypothetical protein